jgi:GNAT superfamily N-acetyltransferase
VSDAPRLRPATPADAAAVAHLSTQLGYPVTEAAMGRRLGQVLASPAHTVVVAELDGRLSGWICGEVRLNVETDTRVEITGLVVEAGARRTGVGRLLVAEVERWAAGRGHRLVVVRSNAERVESHPFYLQRGYTRAKTQHVYEKVLDAGPG